jgi:hypothetical protein
MSPLTETVSHTPGPWQAFNGYLVRKCVGESCAPIAHVDTPYRHGIGVVKGHREVEANIRLIAAAPDLLEALELARQWLVYRANEEDLAKVDAAIKKARGE